MGRFFLILAALSGLLSVALGAFGAHALRTRLDDHALKIFHTGVEYQFFHTFALGLVGLLSLRHESSYLRSAGWAFLIGVFLFSGSLYGLTLCKLPKLGMITPLGGTAFLVGWLLLALAIWKG